MKLCFDPRPGFMANGGDAKGGRKMKRISLASLGLLVLLFGVQVGDGETALSGNNAPEKQWTEVLAKARQEGTVMFYGEIGSRLKTGIATAFKKRYGINVEFVTGKAPEVVRKYQAERAANLNLADIFIIGAPASLLIVKPSGVLRKIDPLLLLPEVTDPNAWPNGQMPYVDKDGTILPLARGVIRGLIGNTEQVRSDEITSFKDLLQPKWKGKITIFDPTRTGAANNWVSFILFKAYGMEEGKKYLKEFAQQEPAIINDARLEVEWVAKGKYSLGVGPQVQSVGSFISMGAPVAWLKVKEGVQLRPGASVMSLPDKPPHPNAATVMVNWLLTAEGQKVFSEGFGLPPSRQGVIVKGLDPNTLPAPGEKILSYGEDDITRQNDALAIAKEIFAPLMK